MDLESVLHGMLESYPIFKEPNVEIQVEGPKGDEAAQGWGTFLRAFILLSMANNLVLFFDRFNFNKGGKMAQTEPGVQALHGFYQISTVCPSWIKSIFSASWIIVSSSPTRMCWGGAWCNMEVESIRLMRFA